MEKSQREVIFSQKTTLKMDKTLFVSEPLLGLYCQNVHTCHFDRANKKQQNCCEVLQKPSTLNVLWGATQDSKEVLTGEKGSKKTSHWGLAARWRPCTSELSRREKKLPQQQHSTWQQSSRRRGNKTDPMPSRYTRAPLSRIFQIRPTPF